MNIIEKAVQEANVEYFATPRTDAFIAGQETAKVSIWEALTNIQDFARQLERELAAARRDAELLRECRDLIAHYATEYEIGDESGELQHWPADEVARCRSAVGLRDRIDAALSAREK